VSEVGNEEFYNIYDYKGIKVYIHKNVKTGESIDIILTSKSFIFGPMFQVNL
jgi:hypothetical protein